MNRLERDFGGSSGFLKGKGFKESPVGIILGTGMGPAAGMISAERKAPFSEVPGMPPVAIGFHSPSFIGGTVGGTRVVAADGRFHFYEGRSMREVASPVYVMWKMGVRRLFIASAVGGINRDYRAGDLVLVKDHISLSTENPLVGLRGADGRIMFPSLLDAYDSGMMAALKGAAGKAGLKEGVLAFLPGPGFETRAELGFLKAAGADLVGWSMVPEVMLARALGMKVAGICCVSDISDPLAAKEADLGEIVRVCGESAKGLADLLGRAISGNP